MSVKIICISSRAVRPWPTVTYILATLTALLVIILTMLMPAMIDLTGVRFKRNVFNQCVFSVMVCMLGIQNIGMENHT